MAKVRKYFTIKEKLFIESHSHLSARQIGEALGKNINQIKNFRHRNNIKTGVKGFKKGSIPWNKGKHYNAGGRSIDTRFRAGRKKENERKMFEVFERPEHGKKALFIKLPDNRQYSYARFLFEQKTGLKLSAHQIVVLKDKGKDLSEDNLEVITRADNVKRNSNREKGSKSMKGVWAVVRAFEDFGMTPPYKLRTKRKIA